jgi:hypothetical protein
MSAHHNKCCLSSSTPKSLTLQWPAVRNTLRSRIDLDADATRIARAPSANCLALPAPPTGDTAWARLTLEELERSGSGSHIRQNGPRQ